MSLNFSVAIILGLLFVFILGRIVYPGKNQQGTNFIGNSANYVAKQYLTVATFNIQTGKSLQGQRDISRAAQLIAANDIVAVQEVYGAGWLNKLGFGSSQTQALAAAGGYRHLFAATRYRWWREQRGNLTLSKLSIDRWKIKMLPDRSRKSPRNMTIAHLVWQGQKIVVINTHLHTGAGRVAQLEAVLQEFALYPRAILMGDFNSGADEAALAAALSSAGIADAIAMAGIEQGEQPRIDWILTKGFKIQSGESQPTGVSDHPYYQVSLSLE